MRDIELESLLDEDILAGDHDVYYAGGGEGGQPGSANMLKNTGIFFGGAVFGILATLITQKLTGNQGGSRAFFGKSTTHADINKLKEEIKRVEKQESRARNDMMALINQHLQELQQEATKGHILVDQDLNRMARDIDKVHKKTMYAVGEIDKIRSELILKGILR